MAVDVRFSTWLETSLGVDRLLLDHHESRSLPGGRLSYWSPPTPVIERGGREGLLIVDSLNDPTTMSEIGGDCNNILLINQETGR